jgi:hypothetical protein
LACELSVSICCCVPKFRTFGSAINFILIFYERLDRFQVNNKLSLFCLFLKFGDVDLFKIVRTHPLLFFEVK